MRPAGLGTPRLRAVSVVLGAVAIVVGVVLTLRPFASLDGLVVCVAAGLVLAGISNLVGSDRSGSPGLARLAGALLVATGLVAALAPDLTVGGVAVVCGIGLLLSGATQLLAGWRGETDERYASLIGGLASVIFGVLALSWQDVTILVIALLVGPAVIVYGSRLLVTALREPLRLDTSHPESTRRRGWVRGLLATGALLLALLLVVVSALIHGGSPTIPSFYTFSGRLPDKPGMLLRQEATVQGMPAGARAARILYTTIGLRGQITTASALVVVSETHRAGRRPVLVWEHGTTGVAQKCAPSILKDPFTAGAMFVQDQILARGWVLVAPDYLGLGSSPPHPYLVGLPEARSSLDAVRAARRLDWVKVSRQTVVWGHSQGGGAALWTSIEAPRYAPDVPLSGVAALAPASDVLALAKGLEGSKAGMLFASFVVAGYSAAYSDVAFNTYVRPSAQRVVRAIVGRCLSEPATLLSLPAVLTGENIFSRHLITGPLGRHLADNVPDQVTRTPTLIGQGAADSLVLPTAQTAFARTLCRRGQTLEYRTYPGLDHVPLVQPNSALIPYLLSWTSARFHGTAPPDNCPSLRTG